MPSPEALQELPARLREPILQCARGRLPPNVALMQMFASAKGGAELWSALVQASQGLAASGHDTASARVRAVQALWSRTPDAWDTVQAVLAELGDAAAQRTSADAFAFWSEAFDRLSRVAPEAGVALYSLGRREILDAATGEIVERMRGWGLLAPDRTMLDLGCGIGRFLRALRDEARLVVGLEISRGMLQMAAARCRGGARVALIQGAGKDFAAFRDEAFDLVYAIDSFPYVVEAGEGVVAQYFAEVGRILGPGGTFLIMNYSYRGDLEADRADTERLADASGLSVVENGTAGLRHWDGRIFRLVKDGAATGAPG